MAKTRIVNWTGAPVTLPGYGIFLSPGARAILEGTPDEVRARVSSSPSLLVSDDIRFEVALESEQVTLAVPPAAEGKTALQLVGRLDTSEKTESVFVKGNTAYLGSRDASRSLLAFDISAPSSPSLLGKLVLGNGSIGAIRVLGNVAYMVSTGFSPELLFATVDVTNPAAMSVLNQIGVPDPSRGRMDVKKGLAAVSAGVLRLYDVTNPSAIAALGTLGTNYDNGVVLSGNVAYVLDSTAGKLDIVNIANPAAPAVLGTVPITSPTALILSGTGLAYVGTFQAGIWIVNVVDPAAPFVLSQFTDSRLIFAINFALDGNVLYAADLFAHKVHAIDVSNPFSARLIDSSNFMVAEPVGVALSGRYIVTQEDGNSAPPVSKGLRILAR